MVLLRGTFGNPPVDNGRQGAWLGNPVGNSPARHPLMRRGADDYSSRDRRSLPGNDPASRSRKVQRSWSPSLACDEIRRKKPIAGGLVFSLKAGNKPPETADDPAVPGPYDAIHKNIQGDGRWVFRDEHY
jgi:hypothetical protein